jgi:hypothetical protein
VGASFLTLEYLFGLGKMVLSALINTHLIVVTTNQPPF